MLTKFPNSADNCRGATKKVKVQVCVKPESVVTQTENNSVFCKDVMMVHSEAVMNGLEIGIESPLPEIAPAGIISFLH